MRNWKYLGVLLLPLVVGACSPNANENYENEAVVPEAQRLFASYVHHGLDQANRSLTELEEEAGEVNAEADTSMHSTLADLRDQYKELSEGADTLVGTADMKFDQQKLALREKVVDLTRKVERTRLEMLTDPDEFKEEAQLRLSELDKRLFQLRSNIEDAGLEASFDSTLTELDQRREEASQRLIDLENAAAETYHKRREEVISALTTLTVRLTESESEYETAAGKADMMNRNDEKGNLDTMSTDPDAVVPIDKRQ